MPARKSQLQGLKTCNRLGVKKKKRRARCTQSEWRPRKPLGGIGSELQGRWGAQNCSPQSNRKYELGGCGNGSDEEKKWIWLSFFFLLLKI